MTLREKAWQIPLRLSAGSFVLNSGLSKWNAEESHAKQLHGFATSAYPFLGKLDTQTFVKTLAATEVAVGVAVLVPVVPTALAGAGLTAFSAGLVGLYLQTPGMRQEGSLRPTEQGLALAKDVWLLASGVALLIDGLFTKHNRVSRVARYPVWRGSDPRTVPAGQGRRGGGCRHGA